MYSLNQSQCVFLPSFQQVSNSFFRGSRNSVKAKKPKNINPAFVNSCESFEELPIAEVAKELTKLPKDELHALIDQALSPTLRLIKWKDLKRSQWTEPLVSASAFFESINGSGKPVSTLTIDKSFLTPVLNIERPATVTEKKSRLSFLYGNRHPQFEFSRGFKTKRSDSGTLPFNRKYGQEPEVRGLEPEDSVGGVANTLRQLTSTLSTEERDKLNAAIHGYLLGKKETAGVSPVTPGAPAKSGGLFSDSFMSAAKQGKIEVPSAGEAQSGGGKKVDIWDKVNKVASLLVIIAIVVSLSQFTNIPFLRMGRGTNEIAPEDIDVKFDDVKGCDEAKQELQEMVEFLMHPEKFSNLGGKLPKGCLLVGPPGTGKTLLARAVAGQAGVPFFHASGSEFDEVLVGQGARRVRDLFRVAKSRAPCVIFIDEIDSVGSKRTSSVLHPYANQTINQLLSEMDGFLPNEGVVVLGATNRSEDLDRALLRPGRFDTQVVVPIPDMKGRKEILVLYLSKIKHDNSIDVEKLAKMTVGFSGADLENMVNTAAIRAAVEGKESVTMSEFEYSHDKHVLGTDWKSRVRDREDLMITAYHEAGHTLVAYFTEGSKPLHKVTIVAKGMSGGHTAFLPEKDSYHETKLQYIAQMDVAMGGRAAEELVFTKEKITGGASHDLEMATYLAELMVKKLGMSEKIGLRVIHDNQGFAKSVELGPGTSELIDTEVTKFLNDSYKRAFGLLKSHRKELDLLADALLNYETLDADDIKSIVQGDTKTVADKMSNSPRIMLLNKSLNSRQSPGSPTISSKSDVLISPRDEKNLV